MLGFFLFLIVLGWVFSQAYDNPLILYVFAMFSISLNLVSYWYSDKIALALARARPASREEFFDLFTAVENLAITAGLPRPAIYVIDDPAPNAFATGRNKEHAAVAVTTGLLQMMTKVELEGVLAHELSHIGNRDILISTVVVVLVGLVAMISDIFLRSMFWGGNRRRGDDDRGSGVFLFLGIIAAIISPIVATLIQLAVSRRREFLADASGALLTRYPEGLASALEKIGHYSSPMKRVSTATSHLFISSPLGGKSGGLSKLFLTHPSIEERVKMLREMA
ncbi:M48 family metallopeptidase [Candidatus Nomurabacteria bacterium]|nr:M48 family metallopeptidase [Candidatus Nomurabacteria bacterium]